MCVCAHDGVTFLIISSGCVSSLSHVLEVCRLIINSELQGTQTHKRFDLLSFSAAGRQYLPARAALFDPHKFNNYFAGMRANTRPIFEHKYSSNCVFRVCEFPLSKSINTQKQNWANQNKLRLPQSAQREQYETGNVCRINK